jgi:hypothetical protein
MAAILAAVIVGVILTVTENASQDGEIDTLGAVLTKQQQLFGQVCGLAGGQVNNDPEAKAACERVQRGESAVTSPVAPVTGASGLAGIGVAYARQIDRCFVEIGLTSGTTSRFGPFCGDSGATGPGGATGATGQPGATGPTGIKGGTGVGISSVGVSPEDHCYVRIQLTNGSANDVGPFCGPQGDPGVTGPKGDRGLPGPACADGYHAETTTIDGRPAQLCFGDDSTPTSSEEVTTTDTPGILPIPTS